MVRQFCLLDEQRTTNNERWSVLWSQRIQAMLVSLSTALNVCASQAHSFHLIFPFILFSYLAEHFGGYFKI